MLQSPLLYFWNIDCSDAEICRQKKWWPLFENNWIIYFEVELLELHANEALIYFQIYLKKAII